MLRFDCPSCLCACHLSPDKLPPGNRARVACPSCHQFLVLRRRFSGDVTCELEQPTPSAPTMAATLPPSLPEDTFVGPPPLPDEAYLEPPRSVHHEQLFKPVSQLQPPPPPPPPALSMGPQHSTAQLLQEFSVLFRLDKRSKRQEHMIAVMGLVVLLTVATVAVWIGPSLLAGVPVTRELPGAVAMAVPQGPSPFARSVSVVELATETVASAKLPARAAAPAVARAPEKAQVQVQAQVQAQGQAQVQARAPAQVQAPVLARAPAPVQVAQPILPKPVVAKAPMPFRPEPVRVARAKPRQHQALVIHAPMDFLPPDDEPKATAAGPRAPTAPGAPVEDGLK